MELVIDAHGQVRCLYGEEIDLNSLGELTLRRVSCVEPDGNVWYADLAPVAGPLLGPFPFRSLALDAERLWIEQHLPTLSIVGPA